MSASQCHFCEKQVEGLPFRCNYCGNFFCPDHRLPENHACPRIGGPKQPGYSDYVQSRARRDRKPQAGFPKITRGTSIGVKSSGIFSAVEQKHIAEAALLDVVVGLSLSFELLNTIFVPPILLLSLIVSFLVSFFGHELSHKFLARRNGLWAEFRLNTYGIIFTLISIIPFFFKFLAPGETFVQGSTSSRMQAKISVIGPVFNVALGIVSFIGSFSTSIIDLSHLLSIVALFNAYMAISNLVPFWGLDGTVAFHGDRELWAIIFGASIALFVALLIT